MITPTAPPWSRLPKQLGTVVAPRLEAMRAQIIAAIDAEPAWVERMREPKVRADIVGATGAIARRFVALIGTSEPSLAEPDRALFRELGAGEAREGRGLEDLLAAYRIGVRVLYAACADELAALDPSPAAQVALAESVFALVDTLQADSADGYAHEASTHAGERDRRLRRVVEALLAGDGEAIEATAAAAGWSVPASVALGLLPLEALGVAQAALGMRGFAVEREGAALLVLAGDGGLAGVVQDLVRQDGQGVRIGPLVPAREARRSLVAAQLLAPDGTGPLWADEHLPQLVVRGAPEVMETLRERVLGPLAEVRGPQRERLTSTLEAWLRHWGQRSPVAAELAVHPQTVAYRVNQLRDLFGDDFDDPDWRFEARLALLR
ncbi:MAG: helix-turn-helix domain-containing protein [Propionicimonas sp.]|uniref:PucR family transcriptional regulator n=1 Tax=Propionicimonas sp. TaxID=1955623 RepID=UPI003D0C48B8